MGLTAAFFWRIFEETGSINAYLAYKQLFSLMTLKKKKNIYKGKEGESSQQQEFTRERLSATGSNLKDSVDEVRSGAVN